MMLKCQSSAIAVASIRSEDPAELRQLMASGEILISWAWNEVAAILASEKHPVEMKIDTKEGASTWVCGYVKMANAPGSEQKAYDFIDAFLSDSAATYLLTEWGYGHTNETVIEIRFLNLGFVKLCNVDASAALTLSVL